MGKNRWLFIVFALLFACLGCQPKKPAAPVQTEPQVEYLMHTVKYSGETLSIIAGWYTGSSKNWPLVLEHNPGLDVKRIRIGNQIRIPQFLVQKSTPMPRSHLQALFGASSKGELRTVSADKPSVDTTVPAMPNAEAEELEAPPSDASSEQEWDEELVELDNNEQKGDAVVEVEIDATEAAEEKDIQVETERSAVSDAEAEGVPAAQKGEIRMKTRDELLRELLEE